MTLTLANPTVDGGGSYTWTGKVWLPTYTQMGFEIEDKDDNNIDEGTKFDRYNSEDDRIKTINKYCAENNPTCQAFGNEEGAVDFYMMSSAYTSEMILGYVVNDSGSTWDYFDAYSGTYGLAPLYLSPPSLIKTSKGGSK